ncbi:KpsF/GutQ family sugar-phosphate isomerase [Brucella suis]|uniref:Sugar isomerase, KpsF/GutQ family n=1 Tax=Brucella suis (strain ATCC 23445 / NCTC 10510) TaxID=470137 RepID=A9WXD9_BRUSI|nr:KpsF/GutQ family sugar-phosphate isomerase [Brucella suis]ABY39105.1 sugar isomerase, KpsF/GutQ family [Brucella suis ATCC 23445]AIB18735.1 Polysialic acid capsule sugar isomerase, KpsF/GutQ family [Brucella suis bv. 2]AIB22121.1 Polysialic acid capsule sugar isomerase, KpsF/GutQ family [Brucella suis bv. 2]AIB25476.1 Polysialic acid capsule sugar isomerase, KpsF/GutQ family [Brucella suis bv. 2]AIB28868.1 Polysialic acid capsule sugar isomerase, KpsF/GutQ family [Brucella suis bv. 2]
MEKLDITQKLADAEAAITSALRTIKTENAGLVALEEALNNGLSGPFVEAVERIVASRGRLVVTGVGKSGHIGSKLAATFASTGTSAFFVHSGEANHGDLGMIGLEDVILAISWSGETVELKGIVNYSQRFRIPLIAITSRQDTALGRAADVVLLLPKATEACPHGLAPTTSTMMQLAIGDALAIALLEARGFTPSDFKTFHPGGSLGASLIHIRDIMHRGNRLPLVKTGTPMPDAMKVLAQKSFGCVVVTDDAGELAGIVTDGDISRNLSRNLSALAVDDIMTRSPRTIDQNMLASAALKTINENHIGALIVVEANRPIGLVHFHDLLRIGAA